MNYWVIPGLIEKTNSEQLAIKKDFIDACKLFELDEEEWEANLHTKSRKRPYALYKHFCRYLLSIKYSKTRKLIGTKYGFDHSTITHSVEYVNTMMLNDRYLKQGLKAIIDR